MRSEDELEIRFFGAATDLEMNITNLLQASFNFSVLRRL